MTLTVREPTEVDPDRAATAHAATGLSARQRELWRYLALQPAGGYYVGKLNGRPAGLAGYIAYADFAFVGNMLVAPGLQGTGRGTGHPLQAIEERGIPMSFLEATPAGDRLYRRHGFVAEQRTLAYSRPSACAADPARTPSLRSLTMEDLDAVAAFDAQRFGTNRMPVLRRLLEDFPRRGFVAGDRRVMSPAT